MVYLSVMSSEAAPTAVAAPPDRRTRGREQRRNQVYEAAVALFIEQGFDNTTMDDIADRADVARATVFNHFARKTAILDEWSARRRHRALDAIYAEHLEDHSVAEILERYMVELAKLSTRTRAETVALMGAAIHTTNVLGNPALAHELAALLGRAQNDGELPADLDPELAGRLIATAYFATLTAWIDADPAPFDLARELVSVMRLVLYGLLPR